MNYVIKFDIFVKILKPCDTMKGVCQVDDPFVCFGAKPDKGFGLEISDATGSRQGNASQELEKGIQRRQLVTGDGEGQLGVDTGHQKRPVGMR